MNNHLYIGNQDLFAVRLAWKPATHPSHLPVVYAHLVIGGRVIGNPAESCFLPGWSAAIEYFKRAINDHFDQLYHPNFAGLNDREIFDMIWEAYPDRSQTNPIYNAIHLDETTDSYLMVMVAHGKSSLKFIWKCWQEPCESLGKLFTIVVERNFVLDTLENTLIRLQYEPYRSAWPSRGRQAKRPNE
ncbi:hypothetical protein [Fibrella aestuarina]|uniref:hypothetical protein n=1 Tax=Fibrella aestuarina TaxID=651143 RepID=UPI0011D2B2DE|nr:hypothetical protein [Fibrella aestuarina]